MYAQTVWPLRLILLYLLLVVLASLGSSIQDAWDRGRGFPDTLQLRLLPLSGGRYTLVSLIAVWVSVWILTRFGERRPLVSLGLSMNAGAFFLLLAGCLSGVILKAIILYTIAYDQLGLLPK
jgi:hypothetical protein